MTLEQLYTLITTNGFKYAYGAFKTPTEPPHLVAITRGTDNMMADNKTWYKQTPIQLTYTYIDKDTTEQAKLEDTVLKDLAWNKTDEVYLSDEKVWQVDYFFEI